MFTVIVARKLGPEGFGAYAYVLSFVSILAPLARFGLEAYVTREAASAEPAEGGIYVSLAASAIMTVVAAFLTVLAFLVSDNPAGVTPALLLVALPILLTAPFDLIAAYMKGREKMKELALSRMVATTIYVIASLLVILSAPDTQNFVILRSIESGLLAATAVAIYIIAVDTQLQSIKLDMVWNRLNAAFPLMISLFFSTILLKSDQVLLGQLSSADALGHYAVAARIFEIGIIAPSVLQSAVFGAMVRSHQSGPAGLEPHMQPVFDAFALAGWAVAISLSLGAAMVLEPVFGDAYAGTLPMLGILLVGMPFYFLYYAISAKLTVVGHYWTAAILPAAGALANIALSLVMIPRFGGEGAAWASVVSYFAAGIGMTLLTADHRTSGRKMLRALNPIGAARRLGALYVREPN